MITSAELRNLSHAIKAEVETEVAVIGGGTSGFIAAVAAAMSGARATLVEYLPYLSGTHGGAGLVLSGTGFYHTYLGDRRYKHQNEADLVVGGLAMAYWKRLVRAGAAYGTEDAAPLNIINDPELTKVVTEAMVVEAGVDVWLMSQFVEAVVDDGALSGVLISRGGGLWYLKTKVVVDASGDGVVSDQAGAPFEIGRASDGLPQAGTMFFEMGGVDIEKTLDHLKEHPDHFAETHYGFPPSADYLLAGMKGGNPVRFKVRCGYDEALSKGELPTVVGGTGYPPALGSIYLHWKGGRVVSNMVSINMDMIYGLDPTNRDLYDDLLIEGKRFVLAVVDHYRRYVPGFENSWLSCFPTLLGIREGRRIVGDHMISESDVIEGSTFPDAIGRCGAFLDVHGEEIEAKLDHREVGGEKGWFHVPYRSLLPKGVEGLLLAGKLISADHLAHGSIRNQVICMMTGHAAGTAAALSAREHVAPRRLPVQELQSLLREQHAII